MCEALCLHLHHKKRSDLKADSELQNSAEHNVWTKQEGNKSGLKKTAWHGASWVVQFARYISEKMTGNSDDRDGTHKQHRREEKGIKVGSLSHDRKSALVSALLEEIKCEIFEHAMYSTDLAPSDYHLFLYINKFLSGQRLSCDQDTKNRFCRNGWKPWWQTFSKEAHKSCSHDKKK